MNLSLLFVVRSLGAGGAERQLVVLAKAMHQLGHQVSVATFYEGGVFEKELRIAGIQVHNLQKKGRWSNLFVLLRLYLLARRLRPNVIHGYLAAPNLFVLALKPFLHLLGVSVACGVRASHIDSEVLDRTERYLTKLHRWALRFADAVICNSQAGFKYVTIDQVKTERYHLIENGIDDETFRFAGVGREKIRGEWGASENTPVVAIVGRHDPVKDQELFLFASVIVARSRPNALFIIVGDESDALTLELKKKAEVLGISSRVIWAGYQSDLAEIYSAIDVLCMCSLSEGFPNVVAEAMCCGTPCVCTDVGDVRRIVGDLGWVVAGRQPSELATALICAVDNLPNWDRASARAQIVGKFSVRRLTSETVSVLSSICRRSHS